MRLEKSTWSAKFSVLLGVLVALAVIAAIWFPEFELWYVRPEQASAEVLGRLKAEPATEVLNELGQMDLKHRSSPVSPSDVIRMADSVRRGVFSFPGLPDQPISPVFSPADLVKGSLKWQLMFASLAAVDQLLEAYRLTGKEEYFELARDNIVAFSHFESSRWLDMGFLWNDHAIAARVSVLIKFWALYRQRADFDSETARKVLLLVARSGLLLAKPEHYAWRTGHGIVSNIALLQISVAFPFLDESMHFRETAQRRFSAHLLYFINREGVTLLHSAGYSLGGALGMVMRLYTLGGMPIPGDWWVRYQKSDQFYARLRRPDGTLPMFGDTGSEADPIGPLRTRRTELYRATPLAAPKKWPYLGGLGFYPEAGYAIWWYPGKEGEPAALSQTVAVWSYYPGLGHKHADELSVLVWAAGRTWLTNVGYWPYGLPGRIQSESWAGSNAPHLRDEPASSSRTSRVITTGADDEHFFIEMERLGPEGFIARREILQIGARTWIVLDRHGDAAPREVETLWTFYPDLSVSPGRATGSFTISPPLSANSMRCSFQASKGGQIDRLSGSTDPFGGWVVIGQQPTAANAVRVRSDSRQGWQLAVCSLHDSKELAGDLTASLTGIDDPEHWSVHVAGVSGRPVLTVTRDGQQIDIVKEALSRGTSNEHSLLKLSDVPDPTPEIAPVLAEFQSSTESSERRVPLIPYRAKVSYVLIALLLLQELLLLALRRRWPMLAVGLRIASVTAWISGGIWLTRFYFVAG